MSNIEKLGKRLTELFLDRGVTRFGFTPGDKFAALTKEDKAAHLLEMVGLTEELAEKVTEEFVDELPGVEKLL